ncbi:hypothetical protein T492DRAFT_1104440 [Pavlovales sp. CCMP2436]|nr:hypothetical protein T492DRAFT_1104440 [Pavlovales sp. CCMP2436]|mmetsp:Transcript_23818/g.56493  ORF Transcript_23818/g.56493 Transcript_23818/m.56493 type:complete len:572 (+) Transcript_23818:102-1817(+)
MTEARPARFTPGRELVRAWGWLVNLPIRVAEPSPLETASGSSDRNSGELSTAAPPTAPPTLLSIPSECLAHVLGFLSVKDVNRFALASRAALAVSVSDEIWQRLLSEREWMHGGHRELAASASLIALMQPSDLQTRFTQITLTSWRSAFIHCCRSEVAVVIEIGARSVRYGFAGDATPSGETPDGGSLRVLGQLQDAEAITEVITDAIAAVGVLVEQASVALITTRFDSAADLTTLAVALLSRGAPRLRFVDADVAAMSAAGECTGVSLFIGEDYASATPIIDGRHPQTAPRFGFGAGALALGRSGGVTLRLNVGMATALDDLCARVGVPREAYETRAELRKHMRSGGLCYVRAIAPARRPVKPDELEIGCMDVRLKTHGTVTVAVERWAIFEHWFETSTLAEAGVGSAAARAVEGCGASGALSSSAGGAVREADGLVQLLARALRLVDETDLATVYRHVVLCGEGASIRGVDQRLASELRIRSPVPTLACCRPAVALGTQRAREAIWVGAAAAVHRDQQERERLREHSAWVEAAQLLALRTDATSSVPLSFSSAVHAAISRGSVVPWPAP